MANAQENAVGTAAADLVSEIFRVAGRLETAADTLLADLGITGARWQILAAVTRQAEPRSAARLARDIGVSRQNVQRLVNELLTDRLLRLEDNPHHKRAKLVVLTPRGRKVHADAEARQKAWAGLLATGLTADQVDTARRALLTLRNRLETESD